MEQADIKTFRELEQEVVLRGLCGKCGGCVSFCSAGQLNALKMGADDLPRFADEERCLACGICYLICPVTADLDTDLHRKFGWAPPIGIHGSINSARATDDEILAAATDGGVVTALLTYLLDRHLIDGALVSRRIGPLTREPAIATTRAELLDAAGTHLGKSSHLEELGDKYTTYSATVSAVKALASERLRRVAMVGTPCQIRTVRKMQCLGILPAHTIEYTIGLFCMENFLFDAPARHIFADAWGISFADIHKLNVKDDVIISLIDGSTIHVPFEDADEMARPACLACMDFSNEYADLSVGGLGSADGYTTVLVRSEKGRKLFADAVHHGDIQERDFGDADALLSERTKMMAKVVGFARRKRARGEARLREIEEQFGASEADGGGSHE